MTVIGSDPAKQAVQAAIEQLRTSETGRPYAERLAGDEVDVEVVPDADFRARYGLRTDPNLSTTARYDPKTERIVIAERALAEPGFAALLAHEAVHAGQPTWTVGDDVKLVAKTLGHTLAGPFQLRNPVSAGADARRDAIVEREVGAYATQAKIAAELGQVDQGGIGLVDGKVLDEQEIRDDVRAAGAYQLSGGQRLWAAGETSAILLGAGGIAKLALLKAAPGSTAARLPILTGIAGAMAASTGWNMIAPAVAPLLPF